MTEIVPGGEHENSPAETESPIAAPPPLAPATPWRRFFGRMLDVQIWGGVFTAVTMLVWPDWFEPGGAFSGRLRILMFNWGSLPILIIIDAGAYAAFGNTPGKWIAGVRVRELSGGRVPFLTYLRRNFRMYWSGLGTAFPLISLFTLAASHEQASRGELLSWDAVTGTRSFAFSSGRVRLWVAGTLYSLIAIGGRLIEIVDGVGAVRGSG